MSPLEDILHLSPFGDMRMLSSLDDTGKAMRIQTPLDLGLVIRDRRRKLALSQTELARKVGVGRQWIVGIEHGKPRAELALVLRTLSALGLSFAIDGDDRHSRSSDDITPVDIDAVVSAAKAARK